MPACEDIVGKEPGRERHNAECGDAPSEGIEEERVHYVLDNSFREDRLPAKDFSGQRIQRLEDLFEGLTNWGDENYRRFQGIYQVLFISFADVKENTYLQARKKICHIIREVYSQYDHLLKGGMLSENERPDPQHIFVDMEDNEAVSALKMLAGYLSR